MSHYVDGADRRDVTHPPADHMIREQAGGPTCRFYIPLLLLRAVIAEESISVASREGTRQIANRNRWVATIKPVKILIKIVHPT